MPGDVAGSVPEFWLPPRCPVPGRSSDVTIRDTVEPLMIIPRELADHTAWNARVQDACRNRSPGQDNGASGDDGLFADPRAAEHDGTDADQRAGLHVGPMQSGVMTHRDSRLKHRGLAGISMDTAQVLDVALGPDRYLIFVRPENRAVPHARPGGDADGAHDNGAGRDPGVWCDGRNSIAQAADQYAPPICQGPGDRSAR